MGEKMSKRFIVPSQNIRIDGNKISVVGEEVHHMNVLRYKVNDEVNINEYKVKIVSIDTSNLEGDIIGTVDKIGEPTVNVTLIQSYLKSDKMDFVVQKSVELGVKNILPVLSKNTVVKLDDKDKIKKRDRLSKIAKEAIEQCGRTDEVNILEICDLKQVDFSIYDVVLICHEKSSYLVKEAISNAKDKNTDLMNIAVVIGPEGGLEDIDIECIKSNSKCIISLGQRVLRAETASLYILSILGYEFGY